MKKQISNLVILSFLANTFTIFGMHHEKTETPDMHEEIIRIKKTKPERKPDGATNEKSLKGKNKKISQDILKRFIEMLGKPGTKERSAMFGLMLIPGGFCGVCCWIPIFVTLLLLCFYLPNLNAEAIIVMWGLCTVFAMFTMICGIISLPVVCYALALPIAKQVLRNIEQKEQEAASRKQISENSSSNTPVHYAISSTDSNSSSCSSSTSNNSLMTRVLKHKANVNTDRDTKKDLLERVGFLQSEENSKKIEIKQFSVGFVVLVI